LPRARRRSGSEGDGMNEFEQLLDNFERAVAAYARAKKSWGWNGSVARTDAEFRATILARQALRDYITGSAATAEPKSREKK